MCLLWSTNWVFISQKMTFLIVTAVKTSNLTWILRCFNKTVLHMRRCTMILEQMSCNSMLTCNIAVKECLFVTIGKQVYRDYPAPLFYRLHTLLCQAVEHQKHQCPYHNTKTEDGLENISLLVDHHCTRWGSAVYVTGETVLAPIVRVGNPDVLVWVKM
jgi:hypothetical protein